MQVIVKGETVRCDHNPMVALLHAFLRLSSIIY